LLTQLKAVAADPRGYCVKPNQLAIWLGDTIFWEVGMKIFVGALDLKGNPCLDAGDVFTGNTYMQVLEMMMHPPFFTMNTETDPDKFIDWCLANLLKLGGVKLVVTGQTPAERAENFFKALMDNNFACYVN
jgi:hypothetical protein